ncbi:MAG TPA: membrane-bound PQQ-dependent dehydrogenase, glucose/quinate/shikimate family [Gammaproteobacteria bacterium]|nr:membrane-bound PQQ-dependent dehydrogenase, glucose/quinate/shikimate family [Gammaproteobacteria bacterium]
MSRSLPKSLLTIGILLAILGVALAGGGAWLVKLGGSWYYAIAGAGFVIAAALLLLRSPAALWIYAAVVAGTLAWSLYEAGLDWWPLAARMDVVFLLGLVLLTPWIARSLAPGTATRRARLALGAAMAAMAAVSVASWLVDAHRIEGRAPGPRVAAASPDGPRGAGTETERGAPAAGEWTAYGRTLAGRRYSPLDQITPENVSHLEVAWRYETGDVRRRGDPKETTYEVTPLEIGNRLFLCTPHQIVIALDATTGKEIWRYKPKTLGRLALEHRTCRGLSYYPGPPADSGEAAAPPPVDARPVASDVPPGLPLAAASLRGKAPKQIDRCRAKLLMPTVDGRLIALNPDDGGVCAAFGGGTGQIDLWANMPNVIPGAYYSTSPPLIAGNRIVVGGAVLDNYSTHEPSGVVRAFDAETGELVWNFDSGYPYDTRPIARGATYTPNSPNSWTVMSADERLGLVYVPLGNQPPDQWGGKRSDNVERFSSSVVALDLATGRVRWRFQTVHHDLWDYDVPAQPSLVDLTIAGKTVPALVQPTKQGDIYVLDRRTGEPILPVKETAAPQGAAEGDHTAPTQPESALSFAPKPLRGSDAWGLTPFDQLACRIGFRRLRYEGRFTPPSTRGSLIFPGNFGTFNWGGIAVDPEREIAFVTPTYLAFVSKLVPRDDPSTLYVTSEHTGNSFLPALNENFGAPFAVELEPFTSAIRVPCHEPPWGYVAAVDLTTGKVIWQHKNGTVRDLTPIPLPFKLGVPNLGGPIMTRGGVAFLSGTLDDFVRAYDVTTGEQLWRSRLPAGGQATPMTYLGADGRQYLVVVAGGHGSLGTKAGDYVIAYALPKALPKG